MKPTQLVAASLTGFAIAVLGGGGLAYYMGYRYNDTSSIPRGFYKTVSKPIVVGSLVEVCPTAAPIFWIAKERGYLSLGQCPGAISMMMKQVVAIQGSNVIINSDGVVVNGRRIPSSAPVHFDPLGRRMPILHIQTTLTSSQVLLMGDSNPMSFDARYFGPMPISAIVSRIQPVLTWN